jgi:hypothetical protein
MRLEIIEWDDAWMEEGDISVGKLICAPYKTATVGWVVKENALGVILAPERYTEFNDEVNYPTFIPRKMITSRTVIKDSESEPA